MAKKMNRQAILEGLKTQDPFDLLIVGGGATGCGIAVDAASRGLKVALVEKHDFAEGTSSKSTKLVHGGVRYLEMAVKRCDRAQYHLVKEALFERGVFLKNAPHLAKRLPLVTPLYSWWEVPYVFAGLVLYDVLAGRLGLGRSRLVGRKEALRRFPMLRGKNLKAGVIYYDGQFQDARMAVTLVLTARRHGAVVANYVEAVSLDKEAGRLCGARVRDTIGGEEFFVRARCVVNAAGPFVDRVRQMDDPAAAPVLDAASGIHIVLSSRFVPPETGLLIPKTDDGRVLFVLPWQGHALIGTTDTPAEIVEHPQASQDEIDYLLRHVNRYFDLSVQRSDVLSAWSGLRPLVKFDASASTAQQVREHLLMVSASGLVSMAGGKWTSYRKMAEEAVDQAVASAGLQGAAPCRTLDLPLFGAEHYAPEIFLVLTKDYGVDPDVARHLQNAFGDQAICVARLAENGLAARLHPDHPYIEAEVVHAARHEQAERASDVLARRIPLAILDNAAAQAAVPRVVELMAGELGWDGERRRQEAELAMERLRISI
ncbi:MAG: FAD-dependent oxidoreductase [Candidatus Accumulibacter sp.]|jgi:glycerol-3-phosphate dehydrogenase|nr:FAD-dependent oxidoreductase [Accumulibacter sp.]